MSARSDRGSATPFLVLAVVGIVTLTAFWVDASARVRAYLRARDVAQAAAEAAAQDLDQDALHAGVLQVDPKAAAEEVRAYLAGVGSEGRLLEVGRATAPSSCGLDARTSPPRWRSCVRVEATERFGPGGSQTVSATGTAWPVAGIREAQP